MMNRRDVLKLGAMAGLVALSPTVFAAALSGSDAKPGRLLILIELKGGNDGLNTVVPYANASYYALRPKIAVARDQVLQLSDHAGLHPAMTALLPLWQANQLAIVQGVGYPEPNLSHFRSIEIWDTASASDEYLHEGWLTRVFRQQPLPSNTLADGLIVGSPELGPLAGGARAVVLSGNNLNGGGMQMAQQAARTPALAHILKVQQDLNVAATGLAGPAPQLNTTFPEHGFGKTVKTAVEALAKNGHIGVLRLTLAGFDTHVNQQATQQRLLKELAEGLAALQTGLTELNRWNDTVITSYAEFGRRAAENKSGGTDHGTANVHFVTGGAVKGGLYGGAPDLANLENGNLKYAIDFRQVYATAAGWCWGDAALSPALGGSYRRLELMRV
ncbi:DUF1501 domain-containing protein [Andreprevotia chitinilytica]|uniref:DUF1501 domain-containing protein n=1 Tax=Andreprevotia chitinilytica TaxID=396808 RepID=UPI000A728D1B|nr:DUF1501 domain-containing protein [Andreprevotia chitinilytica]